MTGEEFRDYIVRTFKRTDKDTEIYEAITDMVMDLKLNYFFEDFKDTDETLQISSLGDYKIALSSVNIGHIVGRVRLLDDDGGSKPLMKRSKETYDDLYPHQEETNVSTGVPSDYCIYGGELWLGQVPDSADYKYGISFSTEAATTIAAGTASVPFTAKYRWILRNLVLAELYYMMGNDEEGNKWQGKADGGIEKIIANDEFNIDAPEAVNYQGV